MPGVRCVQKTVIVLGIPVWACPQVAGDIPAHPYSTISPQLSASNPVNDDCRHLQFIPVLGMPASM
jgi:hypothetical protein